MRMKKLKTNHLGVIIIFMLIVMASITLLSIKGNIVCELNSMEGDCAYGRFSIYNVVLMFFFFIARDIKLTKEVEE